MKAKFVPNIHGFYEVRRLPAVQASLRSEAQGIASRAGEGFEWGDRQGAMMPQGRWRAIVYPDTWKARRDNQRNNILVRELGG